MRTVIERDPMPGAAQLALDYQMYLRAYPAPPGPPPNVTTTPPSELPLPIQDRTPETAAPAPEPEPKPNPLSEPPAQSGLPAPGLPAPLHDSEESRWIPSKTSVLDPHDKAVFDMKAKILEDELERLHKGLPPTRDLSADIVLTSELEVMTHAQIREEAFQRGREAAAHGVLLPTDMQAVALASVQERLAQAAMQRDGAEMAQQQFCACLLYTSDAADEEDSVDLGGRRIIKKKKEDEEHNKKR
eukprot:TRINITY_DN25674_c0_g1_i2.p1 TRINITY_DN25674_c0_g1~~TRINITY_DN25674_c0_g1_i2.p1  ORF type:complete len:244 (-),score=50.71 TRINITY_DN25674_c0_g1_i2:61-792(-)